MAGEISRQIDGIPVVADASAREALFPISSRKQRQRVHREDTGNIERWIGAEWEVDLLGAASVNSAIVDATVGVGIPAVVDASERDTLFPSPSVDPPQRVYREDTKNTEIWNGSSWDVLYISADAAAQAYIAYATLTDLELVSGTVVGQMAQVTNDSTVANNGLYSWDGDSWVQSADRTTELTGKVETLEGTSVRTDTVLTTVTDQLIDTQAYIGDGPIYPIVTDKDSRVLVGVDTDGNLFGRGLLTESAIVEPVNDLIGTNLSELQQVAYTGDGPITPLMTDRSGRVLLGFDRDSGEMVGALPANANRTPLSDIDPAEQTGTADVNHLMFYGQSLSIGTEAEPVVSTSQPYANVTFDGGPRAAAGDYNPLKPLVEDNLDSPDGTTVIGETPCSGAANHAVELLAIQNGIDPTSHVILASSAGHGGYKISALKKGTAWYTHMLGHVTQGKARATDGSLSYSLHAFAWIQGENDALDATNGTTYRAELEQLQVDIENDAQVISGQSTPVYALICQTGWQVAAYADIALAQLTAAIANPKLIFVTPYYHIPHVVAGIHLTAVGSAILGAYFGRAYKQLVLDNKRPNFIKPISATSRGTTITIAFDVPVEPLVIDRQSLAATVDDGFAVVDDTGDLTIESIAVVRRNTVSIVVNRSLDTNAQVRYALDNLAPGLHMTNGASGNLRDSEPDVARIGGTDYPLYNVAPHFELPIIPLSA